MKPESGKALIFHRPFGPQCLFACPRGNGTCGVEVRPTPGDGPRWDKHGPDAAPTLDPSVNCTNCGWHGYIVDGRTIDAPGGASSIHVCGDCGKPEIFVTNVGINAIGQVAVRHGRIDPRQSEPT